MTMLGMIMTMIMGMGMMMGMVMQMMMGLRRGNNNDDGEGVFSASTCKGSHTMALCG